MKDGYVIKSVTCGVPKEGEMELINTYTRRELKPEEVYVFSVVLCDNEIDRDFDKFTVDSLKKLAELYVGKTGIVDHDAKSDNQTARIFSCEVEKVQNKANQLKEDYYRLVARAYMTRSDKNSDFILELDAGIKKEVSVGCSISNITCSICGANLKSFKCNHQKGKKYDDSGKKKLCYAVLDDPTDAYEWSFVAIPAQKEAGVIKNFPLKAEVGVFNMNEIIKKIEAGEEFKVSKNQSEGLFKFISKLQRDAQDGRAYRDDLKKEVVRLCAIAQPEINPSLMKNIADKMSIDELKEFKKAFGNKADEIIPPRPQLSALSQEENKKIKNTQFKI